MRPRLLLLILLLGAACPAAGLSPQGLASAWAYSRANGGLALLVLQHGRLLMEREVPGGRGLHRIYSGTKGFWCVAALAAQADGLLSLDEPASETLPEWRADPKKRAITLRQLLNFTAGLDPGFHLHSDDVADRDAFALSLPLVATPGRAFIYGPGQIQVFCEVLRRKLARQGETPYRYLERRVLRPVGLGPVPHKEDALGNPLMASGFQLTPRQWSRFGLFLLQNPPGQCLCGTVPNPAFGMGFWLNTAAPAGREVNIEDALEPKWPGQNWAHVCICRDAPRDLFVSLGSMGQRLYVVPSLGLVAVRISTNSHFSDAEFLRRLFGAG